MVKHAAALALFALAGCAGPAAAVRPGPPERGTEFEYRGEAQAVAVMGSMTAWRATPLQRRGGRWILRLPVSPGRHEYRFEVKDGAGTRVLLPQGAERVDDGFGGQNAVLRVPGATDTG